MHQPFVRRLALSLAAALVTAAATAGISFANNGSSHPNRHGATGPTGPVSFVVTRGTPGDDTLAGTAADDVMFGLGGNDTISSGDGTNVIFGGPGDDTLTGGTGNDRIHGGPGVDTISAGDGNDVIFARDGSADKISCGAGEDKVYADHKDQVDPDCEHVLVAGAHRFAHKHHRAVKRHKRHHRHVVRHKLRHALRG